VVFFALTFISTILLWYFGTVPTEWYFLFLILFLKNKKKNKKYHSVGTDPKYHNKIVEIKVKAKNTTLSEQFQNTLEIS
jgi:hypothetical protein